MTPTPESVQRYRKMVEVHLRDGRARKIRLAPVRMRRSGRATCIARILLNGVDVALGHPTQLVLRDAWSRLGLPIVGRH